MLFKRDLDLSLELHPSPAYYHITEAGSRLDWAIMVLHAILLLAVVAWAFATSPRRRIFHYFAIAILFIATIYYYVMASNLGSSAVRVEFGNSTLTRQVFYARWVGYTLNFTLIIVALLLLSCVGWGTIMFTAILTLIWGTMYLIGMFIPTRFKWGFFVFAVFAHLLIVWQMLGNARGYASRVDVAMHKSYITLSAYIVGLMFLYAIAWGVCEGGNRISSNREQIFYSVLDILSQDVFAVLLVMLTRKLDFDLLRLGHSEYGRVRLANEKELHHHGDDPIVLNGPAHTPNGTVVQDTRV